METNYQEINLADYIKTIVRRKKLIGKVVLLTVICSLIISILFVNKPPIYETSGLISIGNVNGELIEQQDQTRAFILTDKNGVFIAKSAKPNNDSAVTKSEVADLLEKITILSPANDNTGKDGFFSNIINVAFMDADPKRAVKTVEIIHKLILERHQKLYETKQNIQYNLLAQKENNLKEARENLQQVEKLLEAIFQLRYPAGYSIAQGTTGAEYIKTRNELRLQIHSLEETILSIKNTAESDKMSEVLSPPLLPDTPMEKSEKKLKLSVILIVGSFLGILLGILCAFIAEWWSAVKPKIYSA